MGQSEQQIITMKSSNFLIFSLAVVIAIASCAPKDSVDPFDVVPESDTLLQLKQQMADLSAQNSALHKRVQNLEESLTSATSIRDYGSRRRSYKFTQTVNRCESKYMTLYVNKDKKTPC